MPNSALVINAGATIAGLEGVIDGAVTHTHRRKVTINSEPLAHGGSVVDYASVRPVEVTLVGVVSDFEGRDRIVNSVAALRAAQESLTPLVVITEWATYSEMLLKKLDVTSAGRGMRFTLEFQRIDRAPAAPPPPPPQQILDLGGPERARFAPRIFTTPSGANITVPGRGAFAGYQQRVEQQVAAHAAARESRLAASAAGAADRASFREAVADSYERRERVALAVTLEAALPPERRLIRRTVEQHGRTTAVAEWAPRVSPGLGRGTTVEIGRRAIGERRRVVVERARANAVGDPARIRSDGRR